MYSDRFRGYPPSILARRLVHAGQVSARSMTSCAANNEERCEKYPDEIAHDLAGSPIFSKDSREPNFIGTETGQRFRQFAHCGPTVRPDGTLCCALVPRGQKHLFVARHKLRDDCGRALAQDRLARGIRTVLRAHL